MAENIVRIGRVSSVNYAEGTVSVTYPDLDDSVTDQFPVFSMNDEYKMPGIGQEVLVLHMSNGASAGIVMGKYWNDGNVPSKTGDEIFIKELAQNYGDAYLMYDGSDITLRSPKAVTTLRKLVERVSDLEKKVFGEDKDPEALL